MAKKKQTEEVDLSAAEMILSSIQENYGDVVTSGRQLIESKKEIVHVSPRIDAMLGGGILEGTCTFVVGKEKVGKTTLLLRICAQAQKQDRSVWYLDVEHRLQPKNLEGCKGLDIDNFNHIKSAQGHILSAEKILSLAKQILTDIPRSVVVIDSFGALVTQGELEGELKGTQRNDLHKLLSLFHRVLTPIISINKNILLGVQHLYANTSGMGKETNSEGGSSKGRFLSDNKIRAEFIEKWEEGTDRVGQLIHWRCDYSALPQGIPGAKCESYLRYGIGIDILQEQLLLAVDAGLIKKSGTWFACLFVQNRTGEEKPPQFQGEAKLYAAIHNNPEWAEWLTNDLKELGIS